jgi:hypothetical protein
MPAQPFACPVYIRLINLSVVPQYRPVIITSLLACDVAQLPTTALSDSPVNANSLICLSLTTDQQPSCHLTPGNTSTSFLSANITSACLATPKQPACQYLLSPCYYQLIYLPFSHVPVITIAQNLHADANSTSLLSFQTQQYACQGKLLTFKKLKNNSEYPCENGYTLYSIINVLTDMLFPVYSKLYFMQTLTCI